jgi:Macrocin-O-methyltransferase (TylF)
MMRDALPSDFDPVVYLALNRDVAAAGVDAAQHYLTRGRGEGRPYRRDDPRAPYNSDGLHTHHNHEFMAASEFQRAYARGVKATQNDYRWHWRVHIGLWAAQSALHLPGDFVECGVNRGFLSSAIMEALRWNELARTFFLLDTFGGLDPRFVSAEEVAKGALEKNAELLRLGFYTDNLAMVRANFEEWKNVRIIAGAIPETLDQITTQQVAFLHIDLNCAPPEIAAIEYLWPRLVPGAFVLLDDYAYHGYESQKVAMDAFAKRVGVAIASLPTGQGLLIRPPT